MLRSQCSAKEPKENVLTKFKTAPYNSGLLTSDQSFKMCGCNLDRQGLALTRQ